jgi:pyrroline-5-carboxylate reductase
MDTMNTPQLPRLGIIGGGKMATALIQGLLQAGLTTKDRLLASEPVPAAREALAKSAGIEVLPDNQSVVKRSEVIVLAVKPQVIPSVLAEIKPLLAARHLLVSIAAGITLRQLSDGLGSERRLIRVMPNTPCLVGASASGYCLGTAAQEEDGELVRRMLSAVGVAHQLPEHLLDAVTGLSASGPAFVAVVIEALSDGGVRMGLSRDVATSLAAQTVLGTAKLLLETGLHPGQIKDMVASAGGTTIAGLHALERGGLRAALIDAVEAATRRATELGQS